MGDYKKLSLLISENKKEVCRQLEGLSLPQDSEKIKRLCVDYIGSLTRKDSEYMNQLSLLEQDLLTPVLKVMDTTYASEIELGKKFNASKLSSNSKCIRKQDERSSLHKGYSNPNEITAALGGITGGTIIATICKPNSWGVILFGSIVSAIIGKVLYNLYLDKTNNDINENVDSVYENREYELTKMDVENVLESLASIGGYVDTVLLTYRNHIQILQDEHKRKEQNFDLDKKYIGILECYQTLLGDLSDMDESAVVTDGIKTITKTLKIYGFKSVNYNEQNKDFFNIKEDEIKSIEQFTPAIVKIIGSKEILVLKGDVVLPKK